MTLSNYSGNQKRRMRSAARLFAVQALFQMETSGQTTRDVMLEFEDYRFGSNLDDEMQFHHADTDHFRQVVEGAVNLQAQIDQATNKALVEKWPIARIDPTLRALFRAAGAELNDKSTPPKVVIKEYVELAGAFFPEGKEAKFVNAVLDHMARATRPDEF